MSKAPNASYTHGAAQVLLPRTPDYSLLMYRAGALLLLRRRGRAHARAPAAGERTRAAATRAPARQLTPGVQGTRRVGARPFAIYDTLN